MRTATDCTHRAEECRRLAKLVAQPEDWQHFLEMATTWDMLAKQRKAGEQIVEADEQVADEKLDDEQVTDEKLDDGQVAEKQLADEQVTDEQVADEQAADEQVADEQVADEQVADVLALAVAIANGRAQGRPTGPASRV
jgi:hypothetical protein